MGWIEGGSPACEINDVDEEGCVLRIRANAPPETEHEKVVVGMREVA